MSNEPYVTFTCAEHGCSFVSVFKDGVSGAFVRPRRIPHDGIWTAGLTGEDQGKMSLAGGSSFASWPQVAVQIERQRRDFEDTDNSAAVVLYIVAALVAVLLIGVGLAWVLS